MPLLQFMPWCTIKKSYKAAGISIIPFDRGKNSIDFDELTKRQIRRILSSYKNLEGHPIERAALIKYENKPILSDLTENEIDTSSEYLDLVCFSGLANREFFHTGNYCNADCFIRYIQKFREDTSFIGIISKRRGGRNIDGRALSETVFSIPIHTSTIKEINLDELLLFGLINFRKESSIKDWGRCQNAISCFNLANTDSDAFRYQVEWILLCSAFEQLLGAKSKAEDLARKFSENFIPIRPIKASESKRKPQGWQKHDRDLRFEWMREFYRVRGEFAHGKINAGLQPRWSPSESLVLASISFPLLIKGLLAKKEFYELTEKDQILINIFEALADEDFLNPPPGRESMESWLDRLICEERFRMMNQKMAEKLKSIRANKKQSKE